MTLADELMGKRPPVNLSPGRVVIREEAGDGPYRPDLPRATALAEWVKDAGRFTSQDAADAVEIHRGNASQYLTNLQRKGAIRKVGEIQGEGVKPAWIYEAVPQVVEANRKHFGA
jgi:predicted ArsR family transcriptional regulator